MVWVRYLFRAAHVLQNALHADHAELHVVDVANEVAEHEGDLKMLVLHRRENGNDNRIATVEYSIK